MFLEVSMLCACEMTELVTSRKVILCLISSFKSSSISSFGFPSFAVLLQLPAETILMYTQTIASFVYGSD